MDALSLLIARAALLRAKFAAEAMPNTPPPSNSGPALSPGGLGQAEHYLATLGNRPSPAAVAGVPDFNPVSSARRSPSSPGGGRSPGTGVQPL